MSEERLEKRAVRSGYWLFALRFLHQLFYLARLIILARLLAPRDFGLLGIALLTMMTLETFTQTGFQAALIQKKKDIKGYLDSAWTVIVIRGVVLFSFLYLVAPYAAKFFNEAEAKFVIQIIGLSVLFQAFTNVGVIFFQKELEFNKYFIYQFTGTLADFIVAVSLALIFRNLWALVIGVLSGHLARAIVSYVIHPYRPKISLDINKARELFGFGKWIFGSSILLFLITQGDDIFVGKVLGAAMLGFYQMAYRISNTPATQITHVISKVTFPVYSKLQDNIPKLREAYLRVLQLTSFLAFPLAMFIFITASDFVRIFLGEKWLPMVPAIQVLVFAGLFRSITAVAGPVFIGVGKPALDTKLQVVRLFVLVVAIYPLTIKLELLGASIAVLSSIFIANIGFSLVAIKITGCSLSDFLKKILIPLVSSVSMLLTIHWLKHLMGNGFLDFIIFLGSSIFIYIVLTYILDYFLKLGMREVILEILLPVKALFLKKASKPASKILFP